MRSLIFIASPFRRFRNTCGDEAEHITFPDHMDDVQQPVLGRQVDARLPCLWLRAGVLVVSRRIKKGLSSLFEPNAMLEGIAGKLLSLSQTNTCPSRVENTSI